MAVNLDTVLGSASGIHERAGDDGKKHIAFVKDANACSPGIADVGHMIQGASDFTVATAGTLGVIDFYVGHALTSNVSASVTRESQSL
jgi:hypothetical protein